MTSVRKASRVEGSCERPVLRAQALGSRVPSDVRMNFHERHALTLAGADSDTTIRYGAVLPQERVKTNRLPALLTAPVCGSRFLFPRRFNRAVDALLADPRSAQDVAPEHAVWYFGPAVHLEVDPAHLTLRLADYVRSPDGIRWAGASFIDAADWSDVILPLTSAPVHREMADLVAAGSEFRDSHSYQRLVRGVRAGRPIKRNGVQLKSVDDVEAYFRYCRDLIKSMRKRGVVRHREYGGFHRLRIKHRNTRSPALDAAERDIGVAITEDGKLIRHLGGKHRTAVAQALGLPAIPVEVRLVHVRWIARQMARTGQPADRALREALRGLMTAGPEASRLEPGRV